MHTGFHAPGVGADPKGSVLVELAAAGVEHVVVFADFGEAKRQYVLIVIIREAVAAIDKASLEHFAVRPEVIPNTLFGNQPVLLADPDGLIGHQDIIILGVVILAVQLVQAVIQLDAVNGEIQLAVFFNDLLFPVFQIRDEHFAVRVKVVHAGLHTVAVGADPHVCILIHLSAAGVKQIIVLPDLGKAQGSLIIREVIGSISNVNEAIGNDETVRTAFIQANRQGAVLELSGAVHIETGINVELSSRTAVNQSTFNADHAIEYFSVFVAVVELSAILNQSAANPVQQSSLFVKMIPGDVLHVIGDGKSIAVGYITVHIQPIGPLFQGHKAAEHRLAGPEILGSLIVGPERAANQLAGLIKCIREGLDLPYAGIKLSVCGIAVIYVRFAVICLDGKPSGLKNAHTGIVIAAVQLKDTGQLGAAGAVRAEIVPELSLFSGLKAGQLMDAGEDLAVLVIEPCSVFPNPALVDKAVQGKGVVEVHDLVLEMGAVIIGIVCAVIIRIQTVLDLIFLVGAEVHQDVEMGVNVIAQLAVEFHVELLIFIPCCLLRRRQLQTAQNAQGIRVGRIDGLGLGDEITDDSQLIVMHFRRAQAQIFICKPEI